VGAARRAARPEISYDPAPAEPRLPEGGTATTFAGAPPWASIRSGSSISASMRALTRSRPVIIPLHYLQRSPSARRSSRRRRPRLRANGTGRGARLEIILPPFLEDRREEIEARLTPLHGSAPAKRLLERLLPKERVRPSRLLHARRNEVRVASARTEPPRARATEVKGPCRRTEGALRATAGQAHSARFDAFFCPRSARLNRAGDRPTAPWAGSVAGSSPPSLVGSRPDLSGRQNALGMGVTASEALPPAGQKVFRGAQAG